MKRNVWFQLVDARSRRSFEGTCAFVVELSEQALIVNFQEAVKGIYADNHLERIPASDLKVYKDCKAYVGGDPPEVPRQEPLLAGVAIGEFGETMASGFIVEVPARPRARKKSKEKVEGGSLVKRQKRDFQWKSDDRVYSLKDDTMFFVDQDRATQQLLDFHQRNYKRAVRKGGQTWVILIVDDVFGLRKSTFEEDYIRRCELLWKGLPQAKKQTDFFNIVRKYHTIAFVPDNLLDKMVN
ncbi:hypothetical protein PI124_g16599 [Phytophthora idaei]|nr:hypothetical protein PI125_g16881 [Phytophthora idaei]KAG3140825.1 hypothetical protein PI126_g15810 [Phytophthora idaei]KAG3238441.1 hypothetical protein PI124_g16599 [Phytophthora idaei]